MAAGGGGGANEAGGSGSNRGAPRGQRGGGSSNGGERRTAGRVGGEVKLRGLQARMALDGPLVRVFLAPGPPPGNRRSDIRKGEARR